jgi:hypothetical protein
VSNTPLLGPLALGAIELGHRIGVFGAPRGMGVTADGTPDEALVHHYRSRTSPGGLLICPATPAENNAAPKRIPGLRTTHQVNAWRAVTAAINAGGGHAIVQLDASGDDTMRAPDEDHIDAALEQYRCAAENAADAGFEGVELLCTPATRPPMPARHSIVTVDPSSAKDNLRVRSFALDALHAINGAWPSSRMGLAVGLTSETFDAPVTRTLLAAGRTLGLAYAHLMVEGGDPARPLGDALAALRVVVPGRLLVLDRWKRLSAETAIRSGIVDAVTVCGAVALDEELARQLAGVGARGASALDPDRSTRGPP